MSDNNHTVHRSSCGCCRFRPLLSLLLFPRLQGRKYTNDVAKIYSINVTNVMGGVASYCRPCALEASDLGSSCTSCPAGHYINRDSGTCHLCPSNTILKAHQPYGAQACVSCGPGTKNNKVPPVCQACTGCWVLHGILQGLILTYPHLGAPHPIPTLRLLWRTLTRR